MEKSPVRVRFAPSPTGQPHVGTLRTAMFNWLFARSLSGSFIMRIEDTDQTRKVEGATENLLDALRWLGLDWDEGPFFQSDRLSLYEQASNALINDGKAYRCYCTTARLSNMRKEQQRQKQPTGYDRKCRNLSTKEQSKHEASGSASVIRFAMPTQSNTIVNDLIRGSVSFNNQLIDDFVILKSDGYPTYHLANVVDDHAMKITHVLRAEEWLPSTPRHLQLYDSLHYQPPYFAHLPMILAPDRSKLSKRHGATSILEFRQMGFLSQVMVNFLALLGWSLDDSTEIISADELIKVFTLERVAKSGAIFDLDKLNWLNGHYIRHSPVNKLTDSLLNYWGKYPPSEMQNVPPKRLLEKITPLIQDRIKTLADAFPMISFFFKPELEFLKEELIQKGMDIETTKEALKQSMKTIQDLERFDATSLEASLRKLAADLNLKAGQLFGSLRIANTGQRVSPPLFETMELLGRERSIRNLEEAAALL